MQAVKHTFSELFNGNEITNPFDSEDARYYVIETEVGTYLQTSNPFAQGNEMITDDNFEDISSKHIEVIQSEIEKQKYEIAKSRIKQSLISTHDLSSVDLEGVTFSDTEIGDIIQARVFGGNQHAESALQAKISAYLLSVISGEPNEDLLVSIQEKQSQVNEIRSKFGLNNIS